jgi:hypothetical protein
MQALSVLMLTCTGFWVLKTTFPEKVFSKESEVVALDPSEESVNQVISLHDEGTLARSEALWDEMSPREINIVADSDETEETEDDFTLSGKALPKTAPTKTVPKIPSPDDIPLKPIALQNFKFPTEEELVVAHGMTLGPAYKAQFQLLRNAIAGDQKTRSKQEQACQKMYGPQYRNNFGPSLETLPCLYWAAKKSATDERREGAKKPARKIFEAGLKVPKNWTDWRKILSVPYNKAVDLLNFKHRRESNRALEFAKNDENNCAYATLRAATIRNLENFLPDKEVWNQMQALYPLVAKCLPPDHDGYEFSHYQMAMLALERSQYDLAKKALDYALAAKHPDEETRVLFWRGFLEENEKSKSTVESATENTYWDRLQEKSPLSLHAIMVDLLHNESPIERIGKQKERMVSFYKGTKWKSTQQTLFLFALFSAKKDNDVIERLSNFATERIIPDGLDEGILLAKSHFAAKNYRPGILSLYGVVKLTKPSDLGIDLVELLYPLPFRSEIVASSKALNPALTFALIRQESSFNPAAKSRAGAMGLMQVLPRTARSLGKKGDLLDPKINVQAGSAFIQSLLKQYNNNIVLTIASYNAGPTVVGKWRKRYPLAKGLLFADLIPYTETRDYVAILLRNAFWYGLLLDETVTTNATNVAEKSLLPPLFKSDWLEHPEYGLKVGLSDSVRVR